MMKFPLPRETRYIRPVDTVRTGKTDSKEGLVVPEIIGAYGSILSRFKTLPFYVGYLIGSLVELNRSVRAIRRNPYAGKVTISESDLSGLQNLVESLDISETGFTPVEDRHLFRGSIVLFPGALVFAMEMKKSEIREAPSVRTIREIFRTYFELGRSMNRIAGYLRDRGYNAQAVPAIGSNLNLALLARDAGIGCFGKHGLIITRRFGPSVRLAAVLTDIVNFPRRESEPDAWVREFCNTCNACVRACPAGAIYENPLPCPDGSEQHIDFRKCAVPFSRQNGCTVCIKECVFFKRDYGMLEKGFERRMTGK